MAIPAEMILLPARSTRTLQQQIQQVVADAILFGRFAPGDKMPSTRALARHLGVARITVSLAYTELVASDYLVSEKRSGYFVSRTAPRVPEFEPREQSAPDPVDWRRIIGAPSGPAAAPQRPRNWREFYYPFIYGQADPKLFDHQNWRLCALEALGRKDFAPLTSDYYESDDPVLIEYVMRQILPRRGITARPEQILLTMGAQNALWMAAHSLLGPGRTATLESPGYPGLRDIVRQMRCEVVSVDVDAEGLPPEAIPPRTDVVFATPSHHCPTNVTMPLERRERLLARAAQDDFLVVEDDYEFEIGLQRAPSPALKTLDAAGRVIYVGSFSKSLFPGLRLGYLVAPEPFIRHARSLRSAVLRHPPGHIQRTVAYFLSLGYYDAQVKRLSETYRRRRATMEQAIAEHGLEVASASNAGGSSFWMRAPPSVDTDALALALQRDSVLVEPGRAFFPADRENNCFYRLAYSSIASARIPQGVRLLAAAMRAV